MDLNLKETTEKLEDILGKDPEGENVYGIINKLIDLVPKELKHKKDIPTVIEYKGKRYVYDPNN